MAKVLLVSRPKKGLDNNTAVYTSANCLISSSEQTVLDLCLFGTETAFAARQISIDNCISCNNEKALRETQTLRAGCSKAEPKNFAPPQTPLRGPKFNQLEMATTFTKIQFGED